MEAETLAWFILAAVFAGMALFVVGVNYLRHHADPATKKWLTYLGLLLAGAALLWGMSSHLQHRRETLFEVICPGPVERDGEVGPWAHHHSFDVAHTDVEHQLEIVPQYKIGTHKTNRPHFPVEVSVKLTDPAGETLVDSSATYEKTRDYALNWDPQRYSFQPASTGTYRLELSIHTPETPSVRIRVVDPALRTGKRVEGF